MDVTMEAVKHNNNFNYGGSDRTETTVVEQVWIHPKTFKKMDTEV